MHFKLVLVCILTFIFSEPSSTVAAVESDDGVFFREGGWISYRETLDDGWKLVQQDWHAFLNAWASKFLFLLLAL